MLGMMRYLMTLQRPVHGQDPDGSTTPQWVDVRELYASLEGAGAEAMESGQVEASITWTMRTYATADLTPDKRLKFGTRIFQIISAVPESRPVPVWCIITAREVL